MNQNLKNILENNKEKFVEIPTRKGFGEGLILAGKENKNIVALSADLTDSTQVELFKKAYPERFFEMGVAEQNMASVASGMAAFGKIPFITSYATFSPGRNWEQIRTTICINNVPVKIAGHHAGLSVGPDGATHQALEDIAIMRVLPNMTVVVPCDAIEAKKATLAISKTESPAYVRLGREKVVTITSEESEFTLGKANIVYESDFESRKKIGIIACGELVSRFAKIIKALEKENIQVGLLNMHTIKPLDTNAILLFAKKYGQIVTGEEHQVGGGLGGAVSEYLCENFPVLVMRIGVADTFGQSGTRDELFSHYGLDEKSLFTKVINFVG
jgi:transketolase